MAAKKKGGGSKLSRSEVVTVRLDPKLRFAVELASRKQRRTLSSFIEWAIERAVSDEIIRISDANGESYNALEAMNAVWDVEESDRFIKFAGQFPDLLTFDEERLWKLIKETPYFFRKVMRQHTPNQGLRWSTNPGNIWFKRVRDQWKTLNEIVSGEEDEDKLPEKQENEIYEPTFQL